MAQKDLNNPTTPNVSQFLRVSRTIFSNFRQTSWITMLKRGQLGKNSLSIRLMKEKCNFSIENVSN